MPLTDGAPPAACPESPCVGVCRMGDDGYCEGCRRTLAEIAAWSVMSVAERAAVYARLAERDGAHAVLKAR